MSGFDNTISLATLFASAATSAAAGLLIGSLITSSRSSPSEAKPELSNEEVMELRLKNLLGENNRTKTKTTNNLTTDEQKYLNRAYVRIKGDLVHVATLGECAREGNKRAIYCVRRLRGKEVEAVEYTFPTGEETQNTILDIRTRRKFLGIEGVDIPSKL